MPELRALTPDEPGEPPHAWMQCPCVRGRRRIDGFACGCACHGIGGMAVGVPSAAEANVVRLTRKLGA